MLPTSCCAGCGGHNYQGLCSDRVAYQIISTTNMTSFLFWPSTLTYMSPVMCPYAISFCSASRAVRTILGLFDSHASWNGIKYLGGGVDAQSYARQGAGSAHVQRSAAACLRAACSARVHTRGTATHRLAGVSAQPGQWRGQPARGLRG